MKPEYDAGKNLKEQMESAVALYDSEMSLQAIADALNLNPIKVRKLILLSVKIMPHSIILPMLTAIRFLQSRCIYTVIQKCQIFLQDLQMIRG